MKKYQQKDLKSRGLERGSIITIRIDARDHSLERNMMLQQLPLSSSSSRREEDIMVATEELRRIANANTELKKKVDWIECAASFVFWTGERKVWRDEPSIRQGRVIIREPCWN